MKVFFSGKEIEVHESWRPILPNLISGSNLPNRLITANILLPNQAPKDFNCLPDVAILDLYGPNTVNFDIYFRVKILFADGSIFTPRIIQDGANIVLITDELKLVNFTLCYDFQVKNIDIINGNIVMRPLYITDYPGYVLTNLKFLLMCGGTFKIFNQSFLVVDMETMLDWSNADIIEYVRLHKKIKKITSSHSKLQQ